MLPVRAHLTAWRRSGLACCLGVALATPALAQEPVAAAPEPDRACPAGRFVLLEPQADLAPELVSEVRTDLAAELAQRGLALCEPGQSSEEPAAVVHLALTEKHALIELDDRTTQKRVARDVRIDRVPQAGRALAIAIAIDELLRASWAELTMREPVAEPEPPAPAPAPSAVVTNTPVAKPQPRRQLRFGVAASTLHSTDRLHGFGLGVVGDVRGFGALWGRLQVSPVLGLPVHEPAGQVNTLGLDASLALGACVDLAAWWRLCGGPGLGLDWLSFRGEPGPGVEEARVQGVVVRAEGVAGLSAALGTRLWLSALVGVGGALHGVSVSDGRSTLIGAEGLLLSGQLSLEVAL